MEPKKRDEELPDGWVLCKSKSNPGRNYYFNTKTGKSSWTQPQDDDDSQKETCKKEKLVKKPDKRKIEEPAKNVTKRKSDGVEESASRKRTKNDSTDSSTSNICKASTSVNTSKISASSNTSTASTSNKRSKTGNICNTSKSGNLSKTSIRENPKKTSVRESPRKNEKVRKSDISPQCTSTPKRISKGTPEKSSSSQTPKSAPSSAESSHRRASIKNLANSRLSQLRNTLNSEVQNQQEESAQALPAKNKISPKNDTLNRSKPERKSPINESKTNQSPSDSLHSEVQSPSQFFAANKIISSMKAQLPEEYCSKEKPKNTFAEIEEGICNQTPEYPFSKHPATPPQFSEASKLVSAIKSKLAYKVSSCKEVKPYPSANDRMQSLRARLSSESDREGSSFLNSSNELDPRIKHFEAMDVEESIEVNHTIPTFPVQNESSSSNVVLVVDTNIFIHELDFIKNVLNSHIKGYSEQPTLLVPWRVINELDRLKDNNNGKGALCKRAKAAMDYLYKSLPENNRIKGQSLRDANSHIYPCEMPDDEILNCSLQQVERGRNVILLSNDKNLCNKASINGVKHIDVKELKKLVENKPQPSVDPELLASVKRCQQTVYNLLANILENEMRAKYNNLWQRVLFKPPPWTLTDVLQCLLKHWIAVFNEVFPRIEQLLTDLKNSLMTIENKNPNTLTQSEVANFKELCLDVAKRCQIIPEYMELAKATVDRLLRNGNEVDSTDAVVDAFEGLWTVFSSYCAKLSTELGVPHSIEDKLPGSEPLPVLTTKLTLFSGHVTNLTLAVKSVLSTDSTESIDERVRRLESAFREALAAICASNVVARKELRAFCVNCRVMLEEAHNKFAHLTEVLDVCKSRLASDSAMN